ncbi:lycopene beta-cyclase CrtY [Tsuneonella sp. YG55]|uniref:Lycopene beta-cyclase CrtY n=1 Tax=Tsuneonella litorea TaxID=2976475 RepID=A0A9X2W4G1_9SPHN|nr:lycopene beta-cyclase CrtY [Tsuneonella litorea]MCT2559855.1 lycopene beta-cyclase CrtY [Tsuneonella litorea]
MNGRMIDVAIAGGGLAGGLVALALHRARPELRLALIEGGATLGGNHRWSWFSSDLPDEGAALLSAFRTTRWSGYDVRFPGFGRTMGTGYNSLASTDFDAALQRLLPAGTIRNRCQVAAVDARGVALGDGTRIEARCVIDARGIADAPHLEGGWQVFLGRRLRTAAPHGLARPTVMDADVEQHGSCRFVYTLPLGGDELFVEDTYYDESPALDRSALSARIDRYCGQRGWAGEPIDFETGVLPVITGGDFAAFQAAHRTDGVAVVGARGGFVHPLTSYTLPFAVETALAIAAEHDLAGPQLAALVEARARAHWRRTAFYRRLGRMMFGAGAPVDRYRAFALVYRLPQPLVERFYAARLTRADRVRMLCGRPPVPVLGAIRALGTHGPPLEKRAA